MKLVLVFSLLLFIAFFTTATGKGLKVRYGKLVRIPNFPSHYVQPRNIDVWTPKGYDARGTKQYAVLYMHDGQNLFLPKIAYGGMTWKVDSVLSLLLKKKMIEDCIVVGIWKTDKRYPEYMPARAFRNLPPETKAAWIKEFGEEPVSDSYLKFIVNELKPHIDSAYRTHAGKEHTFIMGSSMGGLISLYGLLEYPDVFGGAGCVSTHWPGSHTIRGPEIPASFADYIRSSLPLEHSMKIYFDYGTETLDSLYEPYQKTIDSIMAEKGFSEKDWMTRKFEGAAHNERSWSKRLGVPVTFLLGKP